MDSVTRGFSAVLLASAVAAGPAFAQVTPGSPMVGPAGGAASITPGNSEGIPAGGTDVVRTTRVGPSVTRVSAHVRRAHHHRARHAARHKNAGVNSAAGPSGSEAPSR